MPRSALRLDADLTFTSTAADGSTGFTGSVTAHGGMIDVTVSDLVTVDTGTRALARQLARSLARRGLRLALHSPEGTVVTLGDVRAPWWQRLVTRSAYIRLGNVRNVRRLGIGTLASRRERTPAAVGVPPPTLLPVFPTLSNLGRRPVTTTHDPRGGGSPRLVFALTPWPRAGDVPRVEYLLQQLTTIGSAEECDIRIAGLEPLHAVVERTDHDEYLLTHAASNGTSTVAGVRAQGSLLRTGAGIQLDGTRMTYFREEYADHGRPYGGRLGGEIGHQRPQPTPRRRKPGAVGRPRTNGDPGRYFH